MIRLSLLGAIDVRGSDGDLHRALLGQPKRLALLAYLVAANPRAFHSRDTLLALLWPDLDAKHARAAFRQALYVLRRVLGDAALLSCGGAMVGLNRDCVWSDVAAFDTAIASGEYAEALALYAGEFLSGFHVSGCFAFERWVDDERIRLADRATAAAWAMVHASHRAGDLVRALACARRVLSLRPTDERALRTIVELLDQQGNGAEAVRAYEDFARRLKAEYAMRPSQETKSLIAAVRSRGSSALLHASLLALAGVTEAAMTQVTISGSMC